MYKDKTITVVIPCYNEEEGIRHLIPKMPDTVDEVLVIDNGCTDNTAGIAKELGATVVREDKKGYGNAYKCGFAHAKGDIIVTMDGDGTYPPESINLLLYILFEEDLDFISARRWRSRTKEDKSPIRLFGNYVLSFTMAVLFFSLIMDSQSGMWVFKKDMLSHLKLKSDGMAFSEEIKIEAFKNKQLKALEIPIYYGERIGTSKLNLWTDGIMNLLFLFKKRLGMV